MVSGKQLAEVGFQFIGTSYDRVDCQAFVELCLKTCGLSINLAGSNTWYRYMTWVGSPEDCKAEFGSIPDGAFLFILEHDGKEPEKYRNDGKGNAKHIGIVTGRGEGAIHSSESRGGVCESKFKGKTIKNGGWNRIGLWNRIDYGKTANWMLEHMGIGSPKEEDGNKEEQTMKAIARSENGKAINLRKREDAGAALVDQVPSGSELEVLERGDEWCRVRWKGKTGYMMTTFLQIEQEPCGIDHPVEADKEIRVDRAALMDIYNKIGNLLGFEG